jgi:hypothetical protein
MDNFDLRKYLTEGRLFENKNIDLQEDAAISVLNNAFISYPNLFQMGDWEGVLEDEIEDLKENYEEYDNLNDSDWETVKNMIFWALDKHGSSLLYLSLIDPPDWDYDAIEDMDYERDENGEPKRIYAVDIFKGFKSK